ncbi:SMP-30/gluconolactonase/LRE family protein [Kribbella sp. NPDC051586]|uniref:SMP-30/gluconolactonase/LRE family protein n=1 Tax=Kribbella sp. NPDC051586 TaxID=3364118 RepID=UPI00378D7FA9
MTWFGPVSTLGECPRWDAATGTLTWVDIDGGTLHRATLDGVEWCTQATHVGTPLAGAIAVDETEYVVALGTDLVSWTTTGGLGGRTQVLTAGGIRLNEAVSDPWGRIWVGSMAYDWTAGAGAYFVREPDGRVRQVINGGTIPNGMGWSPDGTVMYMTETRPGRITAWRVGPDRDPAEPRTVVDADGSDGSPDGLAVDVDGNLWSAFAGGGHVTCFSPAGRVLHRVEVPVPLATSCCFAGPERDRLIVTTGTKRLDAAALERFPESGRMWDAGRVGAVGVELTRVGQE